MISNPQLTAIRTQVNATLLGAGTIYTYARTADGIGGGTVAYTASGTVACTVAPPKPAGREVIIADGVRNVSQWTIAMPWGTTVDLRDRVASMGHTFEVAATNAAQTGSVALMLKCEVIE